MRSLAAAALLALALGVGTASADTFAVVPDTPDSFAVVPEGPVDAAERRGPEPDRLDRCCRPESGRRRSCRAARALVRGAAGALGARRRRLRDPVAGARRDQQDRVELRPQHGAELGRRGRLDAVHAGHLAALGHRRRTATGSPIRGIPRTPSSRPRAISPPRAGRRTSPAPCSPTTTPSGTSTRCSHWRRSSAATSTSSSRSTSSASGSRRRRRRSPRRARRCGRQSRRQPSSSRASRRSTSAPHAPGQLLSDRLEVEKEAFEVGQASAAATAEVDRLRAQLTTAEALLDQARTGAHAASFNPAAAGILGGPSRADGYVFPVGGGYAFVSVAHTHHDYPAADIAAPEGSPVYALADSIVLDASTTTAAGSGSSSRPATGSSGSTATSRNATPRCCRERCSSPASGSASLARPATPPARTSTWP